MWIRGSKAGNGNDGQFSWESRTIRAELRFPRLQCVSKNGQRYNTRRVYHVPSFGQPYRCQCLIQGGVTRPVSGGGGGAE